MPEIVAIPIAFLEYHGVYERLNFIALMDRARIVQAVHDALMPWGIEVDGLEPITTGKPSEQGINFRIPAKGAVFFFGANACKFTKHNVNWGDAEELIAMLRAAISALKDTAGVQFSTQKIEISMHLQPKKRSFVEILRPLLPTHLISLDSGQVVSGASVVKWDRRRIVIDGSAALANAVYVKLEREFDGNSEFETMAIQLRSDEEEIFKILDVSEDQS